VAIPEGAEEVVVGAVGGVEEDADDLGVAGGPGADGLVGRVVEGALGVADLGAGHAGNALEGELDAPEAAGAELRELLPRRNRIIIRALRDGGGGRGRGREQPGSCSDPERPLQP
jgi:hypothetical protein